MQNGGIAVCPLWLLYKCHKGWTYKSGKLPPTRPVAGGDSGMNFPLSELISWVLEPIASAMDASGELCSGEDFKGNLDKLNKVNKQWTPEPRQEGSAMEMEGATASDRLPKLCDCDSNACDYDEQDQGPEPVHQEQVGADAADDMAKKQEELKTNPSETYPGSAQDSSKPTSRQSKAELMKKRRAQFIQSRKSRACRRQPKLDVVMMNSKEVPNSLVQDKSIPMVVIGSDVVSLYPNLRWEAAGEEVYQAVMESDIEFDGVCYKEGARYLALVRGYDWCRLSKLRRALPSRKNAKGTWPGITGNGPLGPSTGGFRRVLR